MTNDTPEIVFVGSREVRAFPKGWQHPKDERGHYIPLLPVAYRFDDDQREEATMPDVYRFAETEIAAYETITEGTPISPAFPDSPEGRLALCNWCAANATTFGRSTTSGEGWAALLFGDAGVALDGTVRA